MVVVHKCSYGGASHATLDRDRDRDEPSHFLSAGSANKPPGAQKLGIRRDSTMQVITAISKKRMQ